MATAPLIARDEIFAIIDDAAEPLRELNPALAELDFRYQGVETPEEMADAPKTMAGKFWLRVSKSTTESFQAAHMMTEEPIGSPALWRTNGVLFVQVFAPRNVDDSYYIGDLLATTIAAMYRNIETPSGVGFYNATAKEVVAEASFWRWNVTVDFDFDERK